MEYEIDTDEPASTAVVRAVAAYTGTPPSELETLYTVVDPEALDALVSGPGCDSGRGREIRFRYNGIGVTVTPTSVSLNGDPASGGR